MNNLIKMIGTLALVINFMSCSGKNFSTENLAANDNEQLSAKAFLRLTPSEQNPRISKYITKCIRPMDYLIDDINTLDQYTQGSSTCINWRN